METAKERIILFRFVTDTEGEEKRNGEREETEVTTSSPQPRQSYGYGGSRVPKMMI